MTAIRAQHETVHGPTSRVGHQRPLTTATEGGGDHGTRPPPMPRSRLPQPTQIVRLQLQPPQQESNRIRAPTMPQAHPVRAPVLAHGPHVSVAEGSRIRVRIKRSELERIRTCLQYTRPHDSPLRQAFVAWRALTARSRALWRLQIKLAARVRYAAMMRVLRVMKQRLKEKREERLANEHFDSVRAQVVLDQWRAQLDRTRKHRSDHLHATQHHTSTLIASAFLHMLVTFRRRHHLAVLLSAAQCVHQRNLLFRSLTHWSDATIEQKRLRAPLAWAQRQIANVQLASKVMHVWALRMADVRHERKMIATGDRVREQKVKQCALGAWMWCLEHVQRMRMVADAHFTAVQDKRPSHDQSIAQMGAALDRWRSVLAHHRSLESASTVAVQHAEMHLHRRAFAAWKRKFVSIRQLTHAADNYHMRRYLVAVRRSLTASSTSPHNTLAKAHFAGKFLIRWRAATRRRIQSHTLADRVHTFRTTTLVSRALRAWIHDTHLRKARGQLKAIAGSIYAANLVARSLRCWLANVERVRDERTRMARAAQWSTHKVKERAWIGWILLCEMKRVKRERKLLAGEYCARKRVVGFWERWVARCVRVRWERDSRKIADVVASRRLARDIVREWREKLGRRRLEDAVVAECEHRRADRWISTCMRAWIVWTRERLVEKKQVEVADTWNAVRLIRKVLVRGMAEARMTSVGRSVHEEQLLKRVTMRWRCRHHERMAEHQHLYELRDALARRILERHLIAWLLHTKSAILKHLKRDRAIRLHQTNLVSSVLRLWCAKSRQKRHLWIQSQTALAFHTATLLRSTFHFWHSSRPDWSGVYARNLAQPREFHELGIVRKAFDNWRVEVVKRKAAVWRMGVVERLRRAEKGMGERGSREARPLEVPAHACRKQDSAVDVRLGVGNDASGDGWEADCGNANVVVHKLADPAGFTLTLKRKQPRLWPSAELAHLLS